MEKVILVNKPIGMTPYQAVCQTKEIEEVNEKIGYAGRLDPMAHGLLVLLIHPETKKRRKYQKMDKEYIFEILFGVSTDTYDLLGKIEKTEVVNNIDKESFGKKLEKLLKKYKCKFVQKYPPYSSASVKGKPLFYWARKGLLQEIKVPQKQVEIYDIKLQKIFKLSKKEFISEYLKRIDSVQGDFRQKEIKKRWEKYLQKKKGGFWIVKIKISCSSGTYVRSLANQIGKKLGYPALALDIKRTKIGEFSIKDAVKISDNQDLSQN